jgi:hypothetical protein
LTNHLITSAYFNIKTRELLTQGKDFFLILHNYSLFADILQLHPEVEDDVNMFLKVGHGGILEDSASGVLGKNQPQ